MWSYLTILAVLSFCSADDVQVKWPKPWSIGNHCEFVSGGLVRKCYSTKNAKVSLGDSFELSLINVAETTCILTVKWGSTGNTSFAICPQSDNALTNNCKGNVPITKSGTYTIKDIVLTIPNDVHKFTSVKVYAKCSFTSGGKAHSTEEFPLAAVELVDESQ